MTRIAPLKGYLDRSHPVEIGLGLFLRGWLKSENGISIRITGKGGEDELAWRITFCASSSSAAVDLQSSLQQSRPQPR
jgi:hypothetical protein